MQSRQPKIRDRLSRRSTLEICEDRLLLACDLFMPEELFGDGGLLHQLQQQVDDAAFIAQQIPFVGDQLADTVPFGVDIRQELLDGYNNAVGEVQDRLATSLNEVLGSENFGLLDEFVDVQFDTDACEISLSIDLSRTVATWELPGLDFDFGLQSLPFYVGADLGGVELEMGFDLTPFEISIDLDSGDIALDTANTSFAFQLEAGFAEAAQIEARVGFLQMNLSDGLGEFPAEDERSSLSFGVGIDFGPDFSIDSTQLTGAAELLLHMQSEVNEYLPSVSADFILQYDLTSGDAPDARFENVSIGLGDLATKLLGPVVEVLEPVIDPISEMTGLLTNPIPLISDLGLGDVSVMDIANGLADQGALPPDYTAYIQLVDVFTQVVAFLDAIESPECSAGGCTDVAINLGDLSLSDLNDDLRTLDPKVLEPTVQDVSISGLSIGNFADLEGLIDRVSDSELIPEGAKAILVNGLQDLDDELSTGASIDFPIINNPAGVVFQWLVGQNADLFTAQADITLGESDVDLSGPLPIGVDGGLRGGFSPSVKLNVGYDTFGLRRFLENRRLGVASASDFLDGFYISDDSELSIKGWLEAYAELNALVFSVEASGGIQAEILASVVGSAEDPSLPDEDGEPEKVRFLSEMNSCAFSLEGSVAATIALAARLGVQLGPVFIGVEDRWELASFDIASFDLSCVGNPLYVPSGDEIVLGEIDDAGVLALYAGPTANQRTVAPGETQEVFEILPIAGTSAVQVNAFGVTQLFENVTQITADLGDNFDMLTIGEGIAAEIVVFGGSGPDILRSFGDGPTTFYGDAGEDVLQGGFGDNFLHGGDHGDTLTGVGSAGATIEIHGDSGNDVIVGGLGNNLLRGGSGNDLITGGEGNNWIEGGVDDDTVIGGPGLDNLFGESGNDRITAGPGLATIDAGPGDDAIFVSRGHADVQGGLGEDRLSWDLGDGTVDFDGGSGFDSIGLIGASGADTFILANSNGSLRVMAPGDAGPVETLSHAVEEVSVDGLFGEDKILVQPLTGTSVQRVNVNLTDNLARDEVEDLVSIHGTPIEDDLLIENVEVTLAETPSEVPPLLGGVMRISGFASQPGTIDDHYEIFAMNFGDRVIVNSHEANDLLTVRGVTGPTFVAGEQGDDSIQVEAAEPFSIDKETGDFLAELNLDGGAGMNRLSVSEAATIAQDELFVSDREIHSQLLPSVRYQALGSGSFGQGIFVTAGNQDDEIHVTSARRGTVTTVNGSGGDDSLIVDSDSSSDDGDLNQVRGQLVLDGGVGQTIATLNDGSDASASPQTILDQTVWEGQDAVFISGFAGPIDEVRVIVIDSADLELSLLGSTEDTNDENFIVRTTAMGLTRIEDRGGDARYTVEHTVGDLQIVGGAGDELIEITPTSQSWGSLIGEIDIQAGIGSDHLEIFDEATEELTFYELSTTTLTRGPAFLGTIRFDAQLESVRLAGSAASNVLTVNALPVVNTVVVNQGLGNNTLVGPTAGASWNVTNLNHAVIEDQIEVSNAATLVSGGGHNDFLIQPTGSVSGGIIGTPVGTDVLDYSEFLGPVTVDFETQSATNVPHFDHIDQFIGGAANDLLRGPNVETNWVIEATHGGTIQPDGAALAWSFESFETLAGGDDNDHFIISNGGQVDAIRGGPGTDLINYSLFGADVVVNLSARTATAVNDLQQVENVTGGPGNDLLWGDEEANVLRGQMGHDVILGMGGDDSLFGSFGLDVLIGGTGADVINGEWDSDLLIAGQTSYDDDSRALEALRTAWSDDTLSYGRRIEVLRDVGRRIHLNSTTVLSDREVDTLFGENDLDWFWTGLGDVIDDRALGEFVN